MNWRISLKTGTVLAAAGLAAALLASLARPGAYETLRFALDSGLRQEETQAINETIRSFSASVSGFYATGYTAGLAFFPAENPVRRRISQDIRNWEQAGMVLVMDRDRSTVKDIRFLAPDVAVAVVDENWFSVYQERQSRRQISDKKANIVTVRYFLKKKWGRWIVFEYEVYPQEEPVPPLSAEQVLKWR